ncbi:hypothetical protein [Mucilaginibacter gracilis]|nr:hypothetical protein [Mucilaginibacter gracilis]
MKTRLKILISVSFFLVAYTPPKKVYIEPVNDSYVVGYNAANQSVNLFIDAKLIPSIQLRQAIKMYVAYYLLRDHRKLEADFSSKYKSGIKSFGKQHRKDISCVIYYLEHEEHGDLPHYYGMDAYDLLDISELKPEISRTKKKLDRHMIIIDAPANGELKIAVPDTVKKH